ncbi:putative C2 domain-containing protein [Helianthus annuus]|nr:putative C2 domain-containing protein [Helianthus annuus]
MPEGVLEVLLVSAKGLEDADLLCKGTTPEWKETFLFDVTSNDATDLKVKIMDSDGGVGADDLVGHARQVE